MKSVADYSLSFALRHALTDEIFQGFLRHPFLSRSKNQHTIAEAVKAIALSHSVLIRCDYRTATGKCADQHQQRRAGQVKICQQSIDRAKPIAGDNCQVSKP